MTLTLSEPHCKIMVFAFAQFVVENVFLRSKGLGLGLLFDGVFTRSCTEGIFFVGVESSSFGHSKPQYKVERAAGCRPLNLLDGV